MERISRATRQTAMGTATTFVIIVGTPGYLETIVIYGRRDRSSLESKIHADAYEDVVAAFRKRGYAPELPPDDLDLDDRNGRANIRAIDEVARGRRGKKVLIEVSADRSAHRIDPAYQRYVNRVARRLRPLVREEHRHRSAAEFERLRAARSAGVTVTGWFEWRLRMDSHWTGAIGIDAHAEGEMTWEGDLLVNRSAISTIAEMGKGEATIRAATFNESVAGEYHILTLLHEMAHSLSNVRPQSFAALPGIEEGLAEMLSVACYPRFMADTFGIRTDRPRVTVYPRSCALIHSAWEIVSRGRGDWAEAEFYADIFVEPSNAGRFELISRILRRGGVDRETIDDLIDRFTEQLRKTR